MYIPLKDTAVLNPKVKIIIFVSHINDQNVKKHDPLVRKSLARVEANELSSTLYTDKTQRHCEQDSIAGGSRRLVRARFYGMWQAKRAWNN